MTDGLVTLPSNYAVTDTIDRLRDAVMGAGLQVFARVDHAAGAREAGLELRPTELLMFGNARGGTPLMQDTQTAGIDLPLKALAWADESGQTWLSYNDPAWIAERHQLGGPSAAAVQTLRGAIEKLARAAAGAWRPAAEARAGGRAGHRALPLGYAFRPAAPYLAALTDPVIGAAAPRDRGAFLLPEPDRPSAEENHDSRREC